MSLLALPRELRDEIISYLCLPSFVYTSSSKPNTENLHRSKVPASTFVDTRIYLPCRISPNVLGVCRQLREECLQYHRSAMNAQTDTSKDDGGPTTSNVLAERLGQEVDECAERIGDQGLRITIEVQRAQRGPFGYAIPVREELSPRILSLLPLIERARKLRIVVWAGYDWWNGSRPRAMTRINGRMRIDENAPAKPDAVSFAIGKLLERLPAVEELEVIVLARVGDFSKWDLPDPAWTNIQYWLDGPILPEKRETLRVVKRQLAAVWGFDELEAIYEQQETRVGESGTWHVKRHGDVKTPKMIEMADEGELDGLSEPVNEEFDRTD
ncbi:hypothetical protein HBI56_158130 [Parastagonospora nodorum]|uniref:Uncharacterized protein n=2 Tax=Phaeosphaeria nodorum (strain SN15 / ATCC MYA-4574 / FGSC 10173) TaxID=321614 RepID=Q0V0P7_PHANO|nr:hypothetical protein SNOG_02417 [Parastagonospora nodorum SN15]KAH3907425.1 hypothetical protein HBH56_188870 [Parastagonospora nodorum]EAT90629.1 hypothetical protein SNOG_02417 [Parastagonospora nodorum SN15]KAH3925023.1 hypothetical protein HBH54_184680 [Parastagonospora nodorum]KAH3954474.1 hypothetical protein HBH53_024030 [Parastagonospora nodorum]KAH3963766.1 hypothetical protein HBH51_163860 [Parastagonospora nodorum]